MKVGDVVRLTDVNHLPPGGPRLVRPPKVGDVGVVSQVIGPYIGVRWPTAPDYDAALNSRRVEVIA